MDIIEINNDGNNEDFTKFLYIFSRIITVIFYSIEDSFAKIIITYNSVSLYSFLFIRGIFVNILVLIYSIILIFIDLPDENGVNSSVFSRFWKLYENKLNILLYIGILILNFLNNVIIFFIIDRFSPNHLATTTIIEHLINLIMSLIDQRIKILNFFLRLIIYMISIIAASIHNEIIILNFCELQKNTKLFLEKEAEKDFFPITLEMGSSDLQNILGRNSSENTENIKE